MFDGNSSFLVAWFHSQIHLKINPKLFLFFNIYYFENIILFIVYDWSRYWDSSCSSYSCYLQERWESGEVSQVRKTKKGKIGLGFATKTIGRNEEISQRSNCAREEKINVEWVQK